MEKIEGLKSQSFCTKLKKAVEPVGENILGAVILLFLGIMAGPASAATWTVDDSGGANFTKIQDAIDNASDGDIILVYSGTYYENVNVTKQLILEGVDTGGDKPVVNANRSGSALILSAGNSTLEGFTAIDTTGDVTSYGPSAGILVISNNNLIRNNNAENNGIGISPYYSSNNILSNNSILNNSIGILMSYSNNNTLSSNNATNNNAGIDLYYSSNNMLNNNNVANNNWDGISLGYSNNNILSNNNVANNNILSNNNELWYYNDGIHLDSSSNNTLSNNNVANNNLGIYLNSSSNNILSNNNALNNYKYGIYLNLSSNNILSSNSVLNNNWGGISVSSSSNNTLSNNNASNNNGRGIYVGLNICYFGIADLSSNNNTLSNNSVLNNSGSGISLSCSNNNILDNNRVLNNNIGLGYNGDGISLISSKNNTLSNNNISNNYHYGISVYISSNNAIYNNLFNNINNSIIINSSNGWNITKISGTNIIGGSYLGGNFWANPNGTGFSQICSDNDHDGICDSPYTLENINIDYLPLTITPTPTAGSISGYKINDTNGNAKWDAGEMGIENWIIRLIGITGTGNDSKIIRKETFTDATGFYTFDDLPAGRYFVIEKLKKGFVPTGSPVKRIKLAQDENSMNNNFTNMPVNSLDKIDGQSDMDDYEAINRSIDKNEEDMDWD